jgi:hypothetical protein
VASKISRIIKMPVSAMALATGAKSFRDNPLLGSPRLNRMGLHAKRAKLAHDLAWSRRRRLEHLVSAEDRDAFIRDGFILKRNYLAPDVFARVKESVLAFEGPTREMIQGDTITRRIAVDAAALKALPEVRALINRGEWRGMMRYVASFDQEPLYYIQTILSHVREAAPDPQTNFHSDTFHPSMKAWLFLTDVAEDEGPFIYVPGSHHLTPERLAWEHETSIKAAEAADTYLARGSFRVFPDDFARMKLAQPKAMAIPANTLIVGDTVGFHARGHSARPSKRVEIWAYSRRNPFLPFTGLDPLSLPWIAEQRIPLMWRALDLGERLGMRGNPWRDVGWKRPLSEAAGNTR